LKRFGVVSDRLVVILVLEEGITPATVSFGIVRVALNYPSAVSNCIVKAEGIPICWITTNGFVVIGICQHVLALFAEDISSPPVRLARLGFEMNEFRVISNDPTVLFL
jgi:hypothetical protein